MRPAPEPQPAKPDIAVETPSRDDARYLLQAGAFQASGDAEALKAHVAASIASYERIAELVFVDSIPKSPSGKILRRLLRGR